MSLNSRSQLDHLLYRFAAPVDDAAIDRVLATFSLAGITGILARNVDAATLDEKTAAKIKRLRWGGAVKTMLGFLTAIVQRRERAAVLKRGRKSPVARQFARSVLKFLEPASDDELFDRLLREAAQAREWTNERIAGEYLPQQYRAISGKEPSMPRRSDEMSEAVQFIQVVMREVGIRYSHESIIAAKTAAKKPKRRR
jgi:hypothetical protein